MFVDNVQLVHTRGLLLEETHYYPFGLTMGGITSKAAGKIENKYKFNKNELQNIEFSDGSGLEWYDFNARTYDQQIGRFIQNDPELEDGQESWTPYHFGFNNPPLLNDPDGKNPIWGIYRGISLLAKLVEWSTSQSRVAPAALTPTVLRDGTSVAKSVLDLKTLQEVKSVKAQAILKAAIEASRETASDEANEKKVPNPNGKKGGEAHQKGVDEAESNLKKEGYDNIQREVKVETPNGEKSSRYIDVRGTKTKTGETKDVQVGKQNKNGTPVARERRAMDDIKKETGNKPEFHPYNKPQN